MSPPSDNPQPLARPRRSRLAIASLALALSPVFSLPLLCICHQFDASESTLRDFELTAVIAFLGSPFLAIVALVMVYRSHGQLTGYGTAISGILIAVLVAFIICGSGSRVPKGEMAYERMCNADVLCDALKCYEHEHGQLPPHLSSLVPTYLSLNNAGALFGPTNYPQFVQSEFRKTVKSVEDAKAADENGPYVYLGHTNHSSGIILFEKPTAWIPYRSGYWAGRVWAVRRTDRGKPVFVEELKAWGVWPALIDGVQQESNTVSRAKP